MSLFPNRVYEAGVGWRVWWWFRSRRRGMCLTVCTPVKMLFFCPWEFFLRGKQLNRGVGVFPRISVEESSHLPLLRVYLRSKRFGGDMSCRFQTAVWDVTFVSGIFLGVISIISLPDVVNCLFKSHLLDISVDVVAESVSVFSFKRQT